MSKLHPGAAESLHSLLHDGMTDQLESFPHQFIKPGENYGADALNGFIPAGQVSGIISGTPSAGEVVRRLVAEVGEPYGSLGERILPFSESLSHHR